ncbi:RiPP maturation radical SAM C-methyltransferase [Nonomuraea typhae]|uniref:RiPP maturation radical SAM C-methyltransferase n=1 Tax=Nonomuraea typhae TaxID=2603600 RepID=A0ABW7YTK7_9ACTN
MLLVSMPWHALERPALGLSLLQAALRRDGTPCDVRYLGFPLAERIGHAAYQWVQACLPHRAFAGEWLFTSALYGERPEADAAYAEEVLRGAWRLPEAAVERLLGLRAACRAFVRRCVAEIDWSGYDVVGFTSTFEQNLASLALARQVKAAYPAVTIVFGGANWEGEMGEELQAGFPFVDRVFSGEADTSFPAYLRGERGTPPPVDLDLLPVPRYDDYFAALPEGVEPTLLLETSRGCWWGAKHHCTFCGLNGQTMAFRSKTAERVLAELDELRRHGVRDVAAVDNILDMRYFATLLPALASAGAPYRLFFEVKANLTAGQVRALAGAGVRHVQPGVESLSDHVLALMRKGTTALRNIQLLKWCLEYGVAPEWNLIYGFPGERAEDYADLPGLVDAIAFLPPPSGMTPVRLDRFSPFFMDPQGFGLTEVRPLAAYRHLYPFPEESLRRLAYYFDFAYADGRDPEAYTGPARERVARWVADGPDPAPVAYRRGDGSLLVTDPRVSTSYFLAGWRAAVYARCDRVTAERTALAVGVGLGAGPDQVREFLADCLGRRLMVRDGHNWLALAVHRPARTSMDHPITAAPAAGGRRTALVVLSDVARAGEVLAWFHGQGFETGALIGSSFAVTAPEDRFTALLGTPGLDRTLDLSHLPDEVGSGVEVITVTPH